MADKGISLKRLEQDMKKILKHKPVPMKKRAKKKAAGTSGD